MKKSTICIILGIVICVLILVEVYFSWLDMMQTFGASVWNHFSLSRRQYYYESTPTHGAERLRLCGNITRRSQYATVSMISTEGGDDDVCWYVVSAQKLAYSLRMFMHMDMVLMIFDSRGRVTREQRVLLERGGWQLCDIPAIETPVSEGVVSRYQKAKMFSKLWVWTLAEYDAVLFLDADIIAFSSPGRIFTEIIPLMRSTGVGLAMTEHNAGVLVLLPSNAVFGHMLSVMHNTSQNPFYAEQDFLNLYWKDSVMRMPWGYNVYANSDAHPYITSQYGSPFKVVFLHFIGKPWRGFKWYDGTEGSKQFWLRVPPLVVCDQSAFVHMIY